MGQKPWETNSPLMHFEQQWRRQSRQAPWAKRVTMIAQRSISGTVTTNGSPVITSANVLAGEIGRPISGTGIPAGSYVGLGSVPGTSIRLSSNPAVQTDVNATADGTGISVNIGTISSVATASFVDVDLSMQVTAPSVPASGQLLVHVTGYVTYTTLGQYLWQLRKAPSGVLVAQTVLKETLYSGQIATDILVQNLTPSYQPLTIVLQHEVLSSGAATFKTGSGGYMASMSVEPVI
jgi:hypothetical protein